MTAEAIAQALGGRRCGRGWLARCPAHQDRSPSLSISERGGKVLVHCFAGCGQDAVLEALRARGLWPERSAPELTPDERRALAEARRRDERDARPARYWAIAAEALAQEALERLAPWALERGDLTELLRTVRGPGLLGEYRAWREREPRLTRAMVRAGENLDRRRQLSALAMLLGEREVGA